MYALDKAQEKEVIQIYVLGRTVDRANNLWQNKEWTDMFLLETMAKRQNDELGKDQFL